jgi:hypothetical protein
MVRASTISFQHSLFNIKEFLIPKYQLAAHFYPFKYLDPVTITGAGSCCSKNPFMLSQHICHASALCETKATKVIKR